ncbi:MAG: 4Fe-4S binding protein [Chloroflexi bacterium]|nr:4Fe-4S binding protein [Chloroflexota bacterium]
MFRVQVDPARCENKRDCLEACPANVLEMARPQGVRNPLIQLKVRFHGGLVAVPVREADCVGCNKCMEACPKGAIKVTVLES